jgi:hypothetical protein
MGSRASPILRFRVSKDVLAVCRRLPLRGKGGVAALGLSQLLQPFHQGCAAGLPFLVVRRRRHRHANAPLGLLGVRKQRPSDRGTTDKRDEFASLHGFFLPGAEDHTLAHHRESKALCIRAKIDRQFRAWTKGTARKYFAVT